MGAIVSCLACQAVSCCAGMACNCCGKIIPISKSIATRFMYVFLFFVASLVQYVLSNWSKELFSWIPVLDVCKSSDSERWCIGALSAARVCFAMTLFHLIFAVFMIRVKNSSDFRANIQDGWWSLKFLVIAGLVVVAYVIPNVFFVYFGWIALFGAAIFIIIQLMLLVDFAYTWANAWIANYDETESPLWYWLLLGSTIVMYILCLAATVLIYVFFYKGSDCWLNAFLPTINVAMCLLLSFLSVHPRIQAAHPGGTGLLQSAVVSVYATYLIVSAITAEPDKDGFHCNPLDQVGSSLSTLVLGAMFTIVAVCFTAIRTSTQGNSLLATTSVDPEKDENKSLVGEDNQIGEDGEEAKDDEVEEVTYNYTFFHITFMSATMFVYMLVTNWATISQTTTTDGDSEYKVDHGMVAVWVKAVSSWLVGLLYAWTLTAPALFPNRDFS
eukprot:TRINITY_DN753_c0_g1_i1.p1 TRINITY_DN753_c0_g1~~TRINITY_DN753_c0_g1_i1.p1  ORF type:complete len:442 (+),score=52.13 TRINITY_DN753_c0_g1_i1:54-1379(+)